MSPTHSVIMPVLNGQRYIAEGLGSALAQLGPEDEVIVVDNGSTDGTIGIVDAVGDSRVRLLHQPKKGPAAARNMGIAAAAGRFITFLDHDDLWAPGRLAGMTAALLADPSADAVVGRMHVLFEVAPDPTVEHFEGMITDLPFVGTMQFHAAAIAALGPFDESKIFGEDLEYLLKFRRIRRGLARWEGDAFIYRRHAGNMTNDLRATQRGLMSVLASNIARVRRGG